MKAIKFAAACAVMLFLSDCLADKQVAQEVQGNKDGPELVLAEKGKSLAPIVLCKDATPLTRKAADELAGYIEKTGGAKPEIITAKRKIRIANGSGTTVQQVNRVLKMHQEMANAMKRLKKMGGMKGMMKMLAGMGGGMPGMM